MIDCGVLICGAGPVGMTVALELARHGVKPRIIDVDKGPTDLSKALVVWRRTLEVLDPAIPFERFMKEGAVLQEVHLRDGQREIATIRPNEGEPASPPAFPPGILVPQSRTERVLVEALDRYGVQVERGTRLSSFNPVGDKVEINLENDEGIEQGRVDWLVGCDGGHSTIRKGLGVPFPGDTSGHVWALADVDIEQAFDPSHMRIELGKNGLVAMFPIGSRRLRVIADMGEIHSEGMPPDPSLADIQEILDSRTTTGWRVTDAHWLTTFGVNERQVESYRHGRVFLAGDAAHVHSPAGGQGMNTGIQDGHNLAWKLALVMRGGAAEALLDTYHAERHPIGRMVVEDTSRLLGMSMLSNPLARVARNTVAHLALSISAVRRRFRDSLTEDNLHYRKGPLADGTGVRGLHSGDFLPNDLVMVDGDSATPHRLLRTAESILLVFGEQMPEDLPARFGCDEAGFPIRIVHVAESGDMQDPDHVFHRFLDGRHGFVLVRPDGVVATVAENAADIQAWIERHLIGDLGQ